MGCRQFGSLLHYGERAWQRVEYPFWRHTVHRVHILLRREDTIRWCPGTYWSWKQIPGSLTTVTAARDYYGNMYLFGRNASNQIFRIHQTSWYSGDQSTMTWSGWTQFPNIALAQVAAATNADGRMELFGLKTDGSIWHAAQSSPGVDFWYPFGQLDGTLSFISVARNPNGTLEIFGTNSSHTVWHRRQISSGNSNQGYWTNWSTLDGAMTQVTTAVDANGAIELFGVNPDGLTFRRTQVSPGSTDMTPWVQLDGVLRP